MRSMKSGQVRRFERIVIPPTIQGGMAVSSSLGDEGPQMPVTVGRVNDCNGAGARSSSSTGNEGVDSGQGFRRAASRVQCELYGNGRWCLRTTFGRGAANNWVA